MIFGEYALAMLGFSLFLCLARSGEVVFGITRGILHLAHGILNFALQLLSTAFDLGPGVACQSSDMALGASHHFVDRSFYSVLIHHSTSVDSKLEDCTKAPECSANASIHIAGLTAEK
jgi:hypothetical protein